MKKFLLALVLALCSSVLSFSQNDWTVHWTTESKSLGTDQYELIFKGKIKEGLHVYDLKNEFSATSVQLSEDKSFSLVGEPYELTTASELYGDKVFYDEIIIGQKIQLNAPGAELHGTLTWRACSEASCMSPEDYEFALTVGKYEKETGESAVSSNGNEQNNNVLQPDNQNIENNNKSSELNMAPTSSKSAKGGNESIWALLIEAVLWGFAMLLTPCVFPMVPMTISFFMKGSSSPRAGRFKAFMYGLFIVLLYTVPICLIIGITWLVGGDAVTADIFNWLATHWIPNIIFFIVFMVFAASFFGAFEITLPSSLVNKSDQNSDKKGLAGVFFMALTLVLVSFSCTGPIVGSVLIKSTQGEIWTPMITMLAFSVAFALPFTIFALFPSLLTKLKSGSWMNSVKVVLGFIEVALGFKFLSVPDQTYHWGLLDREVYLAIWIVVFTLLGFYLLGKIRFAHDDKVEKIGVFRLALIILDFSFVVYMIPGMFGAPLKALSGYLPPIETQDFVINSHAGNDVPTYYAEGQEANVSASVSSAIGEKYGLKMPLGLTGYYTIEEGLEASQKTGKPVFVDITGHGCTNCREMEARVWTRPEVMAILRNDFVIVALYTDDKTKLDEEDWITTESGKVLKDLGRANSYIARSRFNVNAQPNYAILDSEGNLLLPVRGYNLNVEEYITFLKNGIAAFNAK